MVPEFEYFVSTIHDGTESMTHVLQLEDRRIRLPRQYAYMFVRQSRCHRRSHGGALGAVASPSHW